MDHLTFTPPFSAQAAAAALDRDGCIVVRNALSPALLAAAKSGFADLKDEIIEKVKMAAKARVRPVNTAKAVTRLTPGPRYSSSEKVIAIGASTGGVEALQELLKAFPSDSPAILVTQHMPALFTASFANRLNTFCAVTITSGSFCGASSPQAAPAASSDRPAQRRAPSRSRCGVS